MSAGTGPRKLAAIMFTDMNWRVAGRSSVSCTVLRKFRQHRASVR